MLGAKVASSALIDTVDISDPYLVSIGEEAVLAEGALLQSHEMKDGNLSLSPIKIGSRSSVGPYAFLQRGTVLEDGDEVLPLVSSEVITEATTVHEETLQKVSPTTHMHTVISLNKTHKLKTSIDNNCRGKQRSERRCLIRRATHR